MQFRRRLIFLLPVAAALLAAAVWLLFLARPARPSLGTPEQSRSATEGTPARAVKIPVDREGVYEIRLEELREAGFVIQDLKANNFQLFLRGVKQSLWLDGDGKDLRLLFYGGPGDSLYSSQNYYWLVQGDPSQALTQALRSAEGTDGLNGIETSSRKEMEQLNPGELPPGSYAADLHLEQNLLYNPQVETGDHWFWERIVPAQTYQYPLELNDIAGGGGRLVLNVWSSTEAPEATPDHHMLVEINGHKVIDQRWDGKVRQVLEGDIPAGALQNGQNLILVQESADTGLVADINFLDWIEVIYPRKLVPVQDRLEFTSPGEEVRLSGFTGPLSVYDISDPQAAVLVGEKMEDGSQIETQAGHRYLALGPRGYLQVDHLLPVVELPDLRAAGSGADYIAVGPQDLLVALQPLLDYRREEGIQTVALPLQAIYDQFNGGYPEPEAIRSFLRYTVASWQPAPRFLLLVGDGSYDPKGYLAPESANRLPVFLVNTVYGGETASDVVFTQLDQTGAPALAVGRFPAQNASQVEILVQKTLEYEKKAPGDQGVARVLAVADGQDPAFRQDAQRFLDLFPAPYQTELFSPPPGAQDANSQIVQRLDAGDRLVAYFGHGSINMWGKDRLFSTADIPALQNGSQLPVVLNMTCLTGLFTHPKSESLAEALLWKAGGGAAAVLAPTSLTLPTDQSFLSVPLVEEMLADPQARLGEILLRARQRIPEDSPGTRDVLQTFLLFGDPALKLEQADR